MRGPWPEIVGVVLLALAQSSPGRAQGILTSEMGCLAPCQPNLLDPRPTATGRFGDALGPWTVLRGNDLYAGRPETIALEDDQYTGALLARCIADQPDLLIVVDRQTAVLSGDQAFVRIRADDQVERQFNARAYGDRFIRIDEPLNAVAVLANAQSFVIGVDVTGVRSLLEFKAMRPLKSLEHVFSRCRVPVSAKGK